MRTDHVWRKISAEPLGQTEIILLSVFEQYDYLTLVLGLIRCDGLGNRLEMKKNRAKK